MEWKLWGKRKWKKNNIESKITIISRLITEIQIRAGESIIITVKTAL